MEVSALRDSLPRSIAPHHRNGSMRTRIFSQSLKALNL
jgi:hypothetical protein